MFEVIIHKQDNSIDTYDCLTQHQAECVFFTARADLNVNSVELNEIIDIDYQ